MKFSIKNFISKCDQIRSFLRSWSHSLKETLMENFIFLCSVGNISQYRLTHSFPGFISISPEDIRKLQGFLTFFRGYKLIGIIEYIFVRMRYKAH